MKKSSIQSKSTSVKRSSKEAKFGESTTKKTRSSQMVIDLEAPTHALVFFDCDKTMAVVTVSKITNETNRPFEEGCDYITTFNGTEYNGNIITLGSHADCKRVMDIKQKDLKASNSKSDKRSTKAASAPTQANDTIFAQDEIDILKLKTTQLTTSLMERESELATLKDELEEKNSTIARFTNAFSKLCYIMLYQLLCRV